MNVKVLRLISGEEVLGDVDVLGDIDVWIDADHILIKNPIGLAFQPSRTDPTKVGIGFVPWMPYAEEAQPGGEGVRVNINMVVAIVTPAQDLKNNYIAAFGGKAIITPPKSGLIIP